MEKKILIPLGAVIVALLVYRFFTTSPSKMNVEQKTATIGTKKINLEIANTENLRQKGLGGREALNENSGMYFVFDEKPVMASFWMKNMLIPIDIIWIRNGKIVEIDKNVPFYPKDTPNNQLKTYSPTSPIDYVLEVNSGFSDKNNFTVGDPVQMQFDP